MFITNRKSSLLYILFSLLGIFLLGGLAIYWTGRATAVNPITAAWQQAQQVGSYRFSAEIVNEYLPTTTLANVGQASRQETLRVTGQLDMRRSSATMQITEVGTAPGLTTTDMALRIENGQTLIRTSDGTWQPAGDGTIPLAPTGDFLAYAAAVRDVVPQEDELSTNSYAFTLDSNRLAAYLRGQIEGAMQQRSTLPHGVQINATAPAVEGLNGEGTMWIDGRGLPVRQQLTLTFPPQHSEQHIAHMDITFSDYGFAQASASFFGWPTITTAQMQQWASASVAIGLALASTYALITLRRSRPLYILLAVVLSFLLGSSPLLQGFTQNPLLSAQQAHAAERSQQQQDQQLLRQIETEMSAQAAAFDPHIAPTDRLARLEPGQPAAAPAIVADDGTDTDNDGLSDYMETRVGTSPEFADTDGDTITDTLEIAGFAYNGQHWYTDPLQADSNGDTLSDGQEWFTDANNDALPDDTDGDGIPDLFDIDNDDDGVPDQIDLSPFAATAGNDGAPFTSDDPFALRLENIATGQPLFIDVQIRPQNPDHLWHAFNVFDWPEDQQGQFQDYDGATFADIFGATDNMRSRNNAAGDVKLLPMLEITIPQEPYHLIPAAMYDSYGLTVRDLEDEQAGGKVVYIPMSVVTDNQTGERVAFSTRISYLPAEAWGAAHEMRLVWAVQMLVDHCEALADGICARYDESNAPGIIHIYDEAWSLAGMLLREDHGTDIGVIYEDPAIDDSQLQPDEAIWMMSYVLDHTFLSSAPATDDTPQRVLTLEELARRFDHEQNGAVSTEDRFGVPNTLRVDHARYSSLDEAVSTTAYTTTRSILETQFSSFWRENEPIKPLLLFAREEHYRGISLDALGGGASYMALADGVLSVDWQPADQPPIALETVAGYRWSPFCAALGLDNALTWKGCDLTDYWDELGTRYADTAGEPGDDVDTREAWLLLIQTYFVTLARGHTATVALDGVALAPLVLPQGPAELFSQVSLWRGFARLPTELVKHAVGAVAYNTATFREFRGLLTEVGKSVKTRAGVAFLRTSKWQELASKSGTYTTRGAKVIQGFFLLASLVASVALLVSDRDDLEKGVRTVAIVGTIYSFAGRVDKVLKVANLVKEQSLTGKAKASAVWKLLNIQGKTQIKISLGAELSAALIGVIITWAFVTATLVEESLEPGSIEFNMVIVQAIATTVILISLGLIAGTSLLGYIIAGLIGYIDFFLWTFCELGVRGGCFSITGYLTRKLAEYSYGFEIMIDTEREDAEGDDMIVTGPLNPRLINPERGYVTSNPLEITLPLTLTVTHKDPEDDRGKRFSDVLFTESNLRDTALLTSLTNNPQTLEVERGEMRDDWEVSLDRVSELRWGWRVANPPGSRDQEMYRGQVVDPGETFTFRLNAGINQSPRIYLNTGYAFPAYECWAVPTDEGTPAEKTGLDCNDQQVVDGSNSELIAGLFFDILPDTVAEFMTLVPRKIGWGLAWDQQFPALRDADNDGVTSPAYNGLDPDDTAWDTDGDGLSDGYELEQRQQGQGYALSLWDTDNDGLTDAQEARLGTNVARPDTDNDGLLDAQEVRFEVYRFDEDQQRIVGTGVYSGGWTLAFTETASLEASTWHTTTVQVTSDPLLADTDGDGWNDLAEYRRADEGLHPRLVDSGPLAITVAVDDADRIVQPGQTLTYTSTVELAHGAVPTGTSTLETTFPQTLDGDVQTDLLDLTETATHTVPYAVTVEPDATTQDIEINSQIRRLTGGTTGEWRWQPATTEAPLNTPHQMYEMQALPAGAISQDRYLIGSASDRQIYHNEPYATNFLTTEPYPADGRGNWASANAGLSGPALSAHDIATTNSGHSLSVWSQYSTCAAYQFGDLELTEFEAEESFRAHIALRRLGTGETLREAQGVGLNERTPFSLPTPLHYCGSGPRFELVLLLGNDQGAPPEEWVLKQFTLFNTDTPGGTIDFAWNVPLFEDSLFRGTLSYTVAREVDVPVDIAGLLLDEENATLRTPYSLTGATDDRYQHHSPTVASDGQQFLVAWEPVDSENRDSAAIDYRLFDHQGEPLANVQTIDDSMVGSVASTARVHTLAAVWIGDRYRLFVQHRAPLLVQPRPAANPRPLWSIDITADGTPIADSARRLRTRDEAEQTIAAAYNPHNDSTLLVYSQGAGIEGYLFQGSDDAGTRLQLVPAGSQPRVVYHPEARAWLLSWADGFEITRYRLLAADGTPLAPEHPPQQITWPRFSLSEGGEFGQQGAGAALACPAPASEPLLELAFEELPGSTTFRDSSLAGQDLVCTSNATCPTAGVSGAPTGSAAFFAAMFDGSDDSLTMTRTVQDDFTIAFWMRSEQTTGNGEQWPAGVGLVDGSTEGGIADFGITLSGGKVLFGIGGNPNHTISSPQVVADGEWHHIVAVRERLWGRLTLYVDGTQVATTSDASTARLDAPAELRIGARNTGAGFYRGSLDQVIVFPAPLDDRASADLYRDQRQSFCLAATPAEYCRIPDPLTYLDFDAPAGSTSFTNTADSDNPATCQDCPTAGVAGVPRFSSTNTAVAFDGTTNTLQMNAPRNRDFLISFWMQTDQDETAPGFLAERDNFPIRQGDQIWGNAFGILGNDLPDSPYDFGIGLHEGRLYFGVGSAGTNDRGVSVTGGPVLESPFVADGAWHHVVAFYQSASGGLMSLYVDGQRVATESGWSQQRPFSADTSLHIGSFGPDTSLFRGTIDRLHILDSNTIANSTFGRQSVVNELLTAQCTDQTVGTQAVMFSRLFYIQEETPADLFTRTATLGLTVDADAPTSRLTSHQDEGFIRGETNGGAIQTLIIGGEAHDPTSGIAYVELSINGSPWQRAKGAESWVFPLRIRDESSFLIQTRAVDSVGNVEPTGDGITLIVDSSGPNVAFATATAQPVVPVRSSSGDWQVDLAGIVQDPDIGPAVEVQPGSGVQTETVQMLLQGQDTTTAGNGWQPVSLDSSGNWQVSYTLPPTLRDPSGNYTVTVRSHDQVGNQTDNPAATVLLDLDGAGPTVDLDPATATSRAFSTTTTLSGRLDDASGSASLELAFLPEAQVRAQQGTVLDLPGDETAGAIWFVDRSTQGNDAHCVTPDRCPTTGVPGRIDRAWQFDGQALVEVPLATRLNFDARQSFSMQVWARVEETPNASPAYLLARHDDTGSGYALRLEPGGAPALVLNGAMQVAGTPLATGWHHLVGVVDRQDGQARLYVNGVLQGSVPFADDTNSNAAFEIGGWSGEPATGFVGRLDSIQMYRRALTDADVQNLRAVADIDWQPVVLNQRGASIPWDASLLNLTEGVYQVNARTSDVLGNERTIANLWRGLIDNQPPQLTAAIPDEIGQDDRVLTLTGTISDTIGLAGAVILVQVGDGPPQMAERRGEEWRIDLALDPSPTGDTLVVTVQAIDQAGWTAELHQHVDLHADEPHVTPSPLPTRTPTPTATPDAGMPKPTTTTTATPGNIPVNQEQVYLPFIARQE